MVISDGAPVDDSTLSANPGNYLERHLREVIGWVETPLRRRAAGDRHRPRRHPLLQARRHHLRPGAAGRRHAGPALRPVHHRRRASRRWARGLTVQRRKGSGMHLKDFNASLRGDSASTWSRAATRRAVARRVRRVGRGAPDRATARGRPALRLGARASAPGRGRSGERRLLVPAGRQAGGEGRPRGGAGGDRRRAPGGGLNPAPAAISGWDPAPRLRCGQSMAQSATVELSPCSATHGPSGCGLRPRPWASPSR